MEARREQPVERRVLRGRGGKMECEVERTRVPHTGTCRPAVSPFRVPVPARWGESWRFSNGCDVTETGVRGAGPVHTVPLPSHTSSRWAFYLPTRGSGAPARARGKATAGVWASRGFRCGSVSGRSLSGSRVVAPTGLAPGLWDRAPSSGRGPCSEGLWPQAADLGRGRGRAELAASLLRGRPAARLWRPSPWPGLPVSPVCLQLRPRP